MLYIPEPPFRYALPITERTAPAGFRRALFDWAGGPCAPRMAAAVRCSRLCGRRRGRGRAVRRLLFILSQPCFVKGNIRNAIKNQKNP